MIIVLTGDNSFAIRQTLQRLIAENGQLLERFEASDINTSQLTDLVQGQSLFSQQRLVVIDQASADKALWSSLKDVLPNADDDTTLILVERAPDKRTATYKWLQKNAQLIDHPWWKGTESGRAEKWLEQYAKEFNLDLSREMRREMVSRATRAGDDGKPIIDQQQLANAVEQLQYSSNAVSLDDIDAVLAPSSHENVFELLAAALRREPDTVQTMLDNLSQNEDGHRVMGLLASQITNLVALTLAEDTVSVDQIASDTGTHPFALRQLARYANQLSKSELTDIVSAVAEADERLKKGQAEPWLLIRTAMLKISNK